MCCHLGIPLALAEPVASLAMRALVWRIRAACPDLRRTDDETENHGASDPILDRAEAARYGYRWSLLHLTSSKLPDTEDPAMHWLVLYGLGVGTAAVAKSAAPAIGRVVQPAARSAIKGGLILGRELQRATEEARASLGDLTAEAREELEASEAKNAESARE